MSASAVFPSTVLAQTSEPIPSLAAAATAKGLQVGAAVRVSQITNPTYRSLITHQFSQITPENALMPMTVAQGSRGYSWLSAEALYNFALENDLTFHGHTLYWYEQPLGWLAFRPAESIAAAQEAYLTYIEGVVRHFPAVETWQIANELITNAGTLREVEHLGQLDVGFIAAMFERVREHAPNATLIINDYQLDCGSDVCSTRRRGTLRLVEELMRRNAPIGGVGTQTHLNDAYTPSHSPARRFADQLGALGLNVYVTEMDVNDWNMPNQISRRDRQVADIYYDHLSAVLESRAVKRVTFWGIDDPNSWITKGYAYRRLETATPRPLLFDEELQPKPAFFSALRAIEEAPNRYELMTVREAQERLTELGYDPGPIDGQWGRRSLQALNQFRTERGLGETGALDIPSQQALLGGSL